MLGMFRGSSRSLLLLFSGLFFAQSFPSSSWAQSSPSTDLNTSSPTTEQVSADRDSEATTSETITAEDLREDNLSSDVLSQATPNSEADGEGEGSPSTEESLQAPTEDRFLLGNIDSDNPWAFSYAFGSGIGEPTALIGSTRVKPVFAMGQPAVIFPIGGHIQQGLGPSQRIMFETVIDPQLFGGDLNLSLKPPAVPGLITFNLQTEKARVGAFENGSRSVNLPSDADPWVHRLGGGAEYFQPINPILDIAGGLNYQVVSVRNRMWSTSVFSRDELGNRVTVSDNGFDPLFTINTSLLVSALDDRSFPTQGTRFRFGFDQSIPVGDADINMTRVVGNVTQFIPLNLFGFDEGPRTFILNVQGGTNFGDVPPYEAFSMGGANSVRGFQNGDVGTGTSFLTASAEYRYPIQSFTISKIDIGLSGSFFVDYGTDLGSERAVIGRPASARDKDGYGIGYGLGFLAETPVGLWRLEPSFNNKGRFIFHVTVGNRF